MKMIISLMVSEEIFRGGISILSLKNSNATFVVQVMSPAEIHTVVCYSPFFTICALDALVRMFIWFSTAFFA